MMIKREPGEKTGRDLYWWLYIATGRHYVIRRSKDYDKGCTVYNILTGAKSSTLLSDHVLWMLLRESEDKPILRSKGWEWLKKIDKDQTPMSYVGSAYSIRNAAIKEISRNWFDMPKYYRDRMTVIVPYKKYQEGQLVFTPKYGEGNLSDKKVKSNMGFINSAMSAIFEAFFPVYEKAFPSAWINIRFVCTENGPQDNISSKEQL
jgi:hypothetical protein